MEILKSYRSNQNGYTAISVGIVVALIVIILGFVFWKAKTPNNTIPSPLTSNANPATQTVSKKPLLNQPQAVTISSGDPQLDADIQAVDAKLGKVYSETDKIAVSAQEPGGSQ